jgi:hypothetical protein
MSGHERERDRQTENAVGNWRKLPNQEYHDLCFSPNIVRVKKSMKIRGVAPWHLLQITELLTEV